MSSNSFLKRAGRSRFLDRSLALLLALVLLLALLPGLETKADAAYYDEAIQKLIGWNVLRGYPDGSLNPDSNITRAEFVALINRAYGYDELTAIPFIDVPDDAWFHDDISAAYAAGYFNGTSDNTASPSGELTREQALVLLARNMRLNAGSGEVTSFSDGHAFQSYSAGYANTAVKKGLVSGYGDGSFHPSSSITRGEMAVMLSRALGNLITDEGTYVLGDTFGNVTINSANVTLRNTTIAGDLYLTGGLGLGGVTLENVRVLGDIIVAGGGESNAGESIVLRNVTADNIVVDTLLGEYVSLRAEGDTNIGKALLVSDTYLQDRTPAGLGFQTIEMAGIGGTYTLSGNLEKVVNAAPRSTLRISQGIVKDLIMDEAAAGSSLWLDSNATVHNLTLDTAAAVTGRGDVRKLNVNVAGSSTEMLPDDIEIRPGLTGSIAGETMDTTAAAEASSEPRILADSPKVINVAATTATATFVTNKSGTIYWAITAISDGSVNAEALLSPASESRILRSGNLRAAQSNTVYSAALAGLTSGGNYYLTAMLVDARGDYSPIKVVSFTTTDNTVPAFGSGFPYMSSVEKSYAEATVMATKNCQLYWVVFDKGSAAPTAQSFRAGAFTDAYGYGVMDVHRNITETFKVNELKNLEELKSYDIYFWLNDADSAKSSAVRKLTFTTPDKTPPWFITEPTVTTIAATSLRLTTTLNEAGTVYWVIVEDGEEYPKQPTTSLLERDQYKDDKELGFMEYFQLQIANGMNGLKAGSVNVRPNVAATINITGLTAETVYKIYYIARDSAGNYSVITLSDPQTHPITKETYYLLDSNFIYASTLDEKPPTVTQEFTRGAAPRPYAETGVRIVFNERVQYYDANNNYFKPLLELYDEYKQARDDHEKGLISDKEMLEAETEYIDIMRQVIQLCNSDGTAVKERNSETEDTVRDWVVDYRFTEVTTRGKETVVFFPTDMEDGEPSDKSALNLNSDATYFFRVDHIADTADRPNILNNGREVDLERFTTIAAQISLRDVNLTRITLEPPKQEPSDPPEEEPAPAPKPEQVSVDAVFSMTPISVSRADPSKSWDMLLWADRAVEFELYRAELNAGDPAPTASADVWSMVGVGKIDKTGSYTDTYKGVSYWRDIKGDEENPSIRDDTDGLSDGKIYYYAIKLTLIDKKNPAEWTGEVKLWITVDTGASSAFTNLWGGVGGLTESRYGVAVDPNTTENKLTEISVSADGRERFTMTASFADRGAPDFADSFPQLKPTDTTVTVELLLERAGTVHWAVAPAGRIPTRRLYDAEPYETVKLPGSADDAAPVTQRIKDADNKEIHYKAGDTVNFADYDVPLGGNAYGEGASMVIFYDEKGTPLNGVNRDEKGEPLKKGEAWDLQPAVWDWHPHELLNPVPFNITNPEYGSDAQTGYIKADNSYPAPLTISGLAANTEYFLYLVVEGSGGVVSEHVQLYKFKTAEAYRPNIVVLRPNSESVTVTNMGTDIAKTEYALFMLDSLTGTLLGELFVSNMGPNKGQYDEDVKNKVIPDLGTYTVWRAMQEGPNNTNNDSYFDLYADPTFKKGIYNLVTSATPGTYYKGGTHGDPKTLERNAPLPIDCVTEFGIEDNDTNYYLFLSVSYYATAIPQGATVNDLSGNSFSFRAQQPIYRIDDTPPKLIDIYGNLTVDYKNSKDGTPVINGKITMTFDKDLYYRESNELRQPVHQYRKSFTVNNVTYRPISVFEESSSGISILTLDSGQGKSTSQIDLEMSNTKGNIAFKNNVIASVSSSALGAIRFGVDLDVADTGDVTMKLVDREKITFDAPESIWQDGERITIYVNVLSTVPAATAISLSAGGFNLTEGGEPVDLTATVYFNGPCDGSTVTWFVDDQSVVSIDKTITISDLKTDSHDNHKITLTALSAGTATITARCGDQVATCLVTVNKKIRTVTIEQGSITLNTNGETKLTYSTNISPSEIDYVTWASEDPTVVSVSAVVGGGDGGVAKGGPKAGTVRITLTVFIKETGEQVRTYINATCTGQP